MSAREYAPPTSKWAVLEWAHPYYCRSVARCYSCDRVLSAVRARLGITCESCTRETQVIRP